MTIVKEIRESDAVINYILSSLLQVEPSWLMISWTKRLNQILGENGMNRFVNDWNTLKDKQLQQNQ